LPKLRRVSHYFLVALGGALGSVLRFWCAAQFERRLGEGFPWGTLFVNVTGSFLIGLLFALATRAGEPLLAPSARAFALVGVLGGFTTFSAFSLQTLNLLRGGQAGLAVANVALSLSLCLLAVWLGHLLASALHR
jgi:fluoride exporter